MFKFLSPLFFVLLLICALVSVNGQDEEEPEDNEFVYTYPCDTEDVLMTRPSGELTPETNYFEITLSLTEYTYLKSLKLVVKVDAPSKIKIDPATGKVSGPKVGKIFRITYFGTPDEVGDVSFRITGTQKDKLPKITHLHLNNRNLCRKAAQTTKPTPTTTTTTKKPPVGPKAVGCGRRQITQSAYITNGWEVRPGDFPWHVALYHKSQRSSSYKCGGTLINKQSVITAAHCLFVNGREIVPEKLSVQLGKHNLNILDTSTVEHQVLRIIVHPEYSTVDLQDDIAILRLDSVVTYTQHIFPACLWKAEKKSLDNVIGKKGTVVGWGLTEEDTLAEVLNAGTMPVVSFTECLESNRDFFGPFLSDFNYCAGYRNGTSVCNGDSGGGMFFKEGDAWTLRGLVSFSSVREDRDVCNPLNYVIFTDVAKYLDWINANI